MGTMLESAVEERLRKDGYFNFVALFTWPHEADKVARERFGLYFKDPKKLFEKTGMDPKYCQGYGLTGARTILVVGLAPSSRALYLYCSEITHDTEIEAKVYHAVDTNELRDVVYRKP